MRRRLVEALDAICTSRRQISYRQAFQYLGIYVCGYGPRRDAALARAFARAERALVEAERKQQ